MIIASRVTTNDKDNHERPNEFFFWFLKIIDFIVYPLWGFSRYGKDDDDDMSDE